MPFEITRRGAIATSVAALLAPAAVAMEATTHEVQMLNVDPENPRARQVFIPRVLVVQPGDTVRFLSVDRGHNSEAIAEMIPEGVEGWSGGIGEDVEVTLDTPGVYGYKCTPHATVGMVGVVVVAGEGALDNLEAAQDVRQRGRARQVWDEIWEEVAALELA